MGLEGDPDLEQTEASVVSWIWQEISSSYLNIALTVAILYLLYKILLQKEEEQPISVEPPVPPMKKQVSCYRINMGTTTESPCSMTLYLNIRT